MASHDTDDTVPGHWIVRLRPYLTATTQQSHISKIKSMTDNDSIPSFKCTITREFEFPSAMRGYSAAFEGQTKEQLEQMDEVISVEPDRRYKHCATQTDAPWGLARISTRGRLPTSNHTDLHQYQYQDSASGQNTLAYVLDTGIKDDHVEFEGRARRGPKFVTSSTPVSEEDVNGHGTHIAGTIASRTFGVAKKAQVVSVKVFNDEREPRALTSDIIRALQWVVDNARERGRKAVVNLSLGGGLSASMNDAVAAAVRNGLIVCVAAGNEAMPAENTSPASEPLAITVGATNIRDEIASFSNYGKMVDIFAPGDQILSTWIHNNELTRRLRGTSMASPHVAGAACCLLSDPNWTSERLNYNVISELLIRADKNTIQGLETKSRTIDAVLQTSD